MSSLDFSQNEKIKDILTDENTRLREKKQTIDDAIISQNRIIHFNDNSRKIHGAYIRILIVFTIILAILWIVTTIKEMITFIPDWIFDIILVLTICIGVIIIYNYYIEIIRRNRYNFDELNNSPPTTKSTDSDVSNASNGNIMGGLLDICIGKDCCNPRPAGNVPISTTDIYTIWDETTSKCIKETFTTMENGTIPKEEYEYTNYSPYK
jgi:hypothetical protein